MIAKALPKDCWRRFFALRSGALGAREVDMEIHGLKPAAQAQAHWTGRPAMSYDTRTGAFSLTLGGLCHQIFPVRNIFVSETDGRLEGVDVIEKNGTRHMIRLRQPLTPAAPPPEARRPMPANSRAAIRTARAVPEQPAM